MTEGISVKLVISDAGGNETVLDMDSAIVGGVLKGQPEHTAGGHFGKMDSHNLLNAYLTVSRAFIHTAEEQVEVVRESLGKLTGVLPDRAPTDMKELRRMMVRLVDLTISIEENRSVETYGLDEGIAKFRIDGSGGRS